MIGLMLVGRVVSYLEATSPAQIQPSRPVPHLTLSRWPGTAAKLQQIHDEIAGPHRWPSLAWTQQTWEQRLASSSIRWFAILLDQNVAGLLEIELHLGHEVEISIFGLRPTFQGQGLGGPALTLSIEAAWSAAPDTTRVWLHTSTRDGPRALANYLARGLRVTSTETRTEELPD